MKSWLIVLLFFCPFFCNGQTNEKYQRTIDSFKRTGQEEKLIPYFNREVKLRPKNEAALKALGFLYLENDQFEEGEKYFRDALNVNPKCAHCYMSLGIVYSIKKDFPKASEYFDKSISLEPGSAYLYSMRANFRVMEGDKDEALFDCNKAISLDGQNMEYYMQRGKLNGLQGYFYLALADFNKAVELSPQNYEPYSGRADLYNQKGMKKEALADIDKAIAFDSSKVNLYSMRGNIYADISEYPKAINDYTYAIKLEPKDFHLVFNRAQCFYAQEDMDGYCADIDASYQVLLKYAQVDTMKPILEHTIRIYCDPSNENYYYHRGIAAYNLKQYSKAIVYYDEANKKFPDNSLIWSFRGNALFMLKDYTHAIDDYNESIRNKANIYVDLKETEINSMAIENYIKGLFAGERFSLAESKFALGKYEEALGEIDSGIELTRGLMEFDKETYFNARGIILETLGKNEEAIKNFDTSIALNPLFEPAWVNRASAKIYKGIDIKRICSGIYATFNSEAVNASWRLPDIAFRRNDPDNCASAMEDCSRALLLEPKDEYAFYLRGRIKKGIGRVDYCFDLIKARELGFPVEPDLITDCGK